MPSLRASSVCPAAVPARRPHRAIRTAIEVAFIIRVIPPESARGRTHVAAFRIYRTIGIRRTLLESSPPFAHPHVSTGGGASLTGRGACDRLHWLGIAAV